MSTLNYNQIRFLKSVSHCRDLPDDQGSEVAFAGRSNAGKSSAINAITQISRLARTSKTPGRTQLINFFELGHQRHLVDLPGYGFAKVPDTVQDAWESLISEYLSHRQCLKGVILLMDARHPLKPTDHQLIDWCLAHSLPVHILLTKADKLSFSASKQTLMQVQKQLAQVQDLVSVQLFSSLKRQGIEEAKAVLDKWFGL